MTARTEFVPVRMTPAEKKLTEEFAQLTDTSTSEFIRIAVAERIGRLISADARRVEDAQHFDSMQTLSRYEATN